MIEYEVSDDRATIHTPSLRLRFEWTGDRWTHGIERDNGQCWEEVARAIEANDDRDGTARVVSPTFQELRLQRDGSGVLQALLVGQSGPHHFSSVLGVSISGETTRVDVDVADRCRATVETLASTYRVRLDIGSLSAASPAGVLWRPREWNIAALRFETWGPPAHQARIALAEAGRGSLQIQAEAREQPETPTRRWCYRWSWDTSTNR